MAIEGGPCERPPSALERDRRVTWAEWRKAATLTAVDGGAPQQVDLGHEGGLSVASSVHGLPPVGQSESIERLRAAVERRRSKRRQQEHKSKSVSLEAVGHEWGSIGFPRENSSSRLRQPIASDGALDDIPSTGRRHWAREPAPHPPSGSLHEIEVLGEKISILAFSSRTNSGLSPLAEGPESSSPVAQPPIDLQSQPSQVSSMVLDRQPSDHSREVDSGDFDVRSLSTRDLMQHLSRRQSRRAESACALRMCNPQHSEYLAVADDVHAIQSGALSGSNIFLVSLDDEEATFYCQRCVHKIEKLRGLEVEIRALKSAIEARKTRDRTVEAKIAKKEKGKKGDELAFLRKELDALQLTVNYLHSTLVNMEERTLKNDRSQNRNPRGGRVHSGAKTDGKSFRI
mmetsp:Transcript_10640/g.21415  ORF Transcript_10640/g.21415 Transcript_10640/m.21415 type:complete len:401 (-) Transcript_10640:4301-5503(-)